MKRKTAETADLEADLMEALEEDGEPFQKRTAYTPSLGTLEHLPGGVLANVLSRLPADALAAAEAACAVLRRTARDDFFWRRLLDARWPGRAEECPGWVEGGGTDSGKCKAAYFWLDAADVRTAMASSSREMRPYRMQMLLAERGRPPPAPGQAPLAPRGPPQSPDDRALAQWRQRLGFQGPPPPTCLCTRPKGFHRSTTRALSICEGCGWQHECGGQGCSEQCLDASGIAVCPISGICFSGSYSPEGAAAEGDGPEGDVPPDQVDDYLYTGRLGSAFALGYECGSERELRYLHALGRRPSPWTPA